MRAAAFAVLTLALVAPPPGATAPSPAAGEPHLLRYERREAGAADFLAAGDFDRDGHSDLVAASRSEATLWWLPGRGDGLWGVDIRANSIYSNSGLGIDLGDGTSIADGVTANDPGDSDLGPNDRQNFPLINAVFTEASRPGCTAASRVPNLDYRIDVFGNASCQPSGHGEGRTHLGAATVGADSAGTAPFALTVPSVVLPGFPVTATATRVFPGHTSELSACAVSETFSAGEDDRVLTAETLSGTQTLEACRSITAHSGVEITGDVTLQAGRRIVPGDGFSIGPGGSFAALVEVP